MSAVSEKAAKDIVAERFLRDGEVDASSLFGTEYVSQKLNCRADVIFTRPLHAVEIKTATDSLKRLPNQVRLLSAMFPFVSIACATKHIRGVRAIVPAEVGIYELQSATTFRRIRRAKKNRSFRVEHAITLLPNHELAKLGEVRVKTTTRTALEMNALRLGEQKIISAISQYVERRIGTPKTEHSRHAKTMDKISESASRDNIDWNKYISFGPVPNDIAALYRSDN